LGGRRKETHEKMGSPGQVRRISKFKRNCCHEILDRVAVTLAGNSVRVNFLIVIIIHAGSTYGGKRRVQPEKPL
jgi:hypothetical protein